MREAFLERVDAQGGGNGFEAEQEEQEDLGSGRSP